MAALCPGVQYGLSSQQNFGENKQLIFVKLTDSALRAIEDYLKNQNKSSLHSPRIKFLGNETGELSFPSQHNGQTSFSFSMSSTADMGGPGGSFECIQGSSPMGPLESLGSIPYKIRVNANDDVYETTRNRMTEVEDKYKNKCTRVIKPNQTDIGRKVKVKQLPSSSRPSMPSAQQPRTSMRDSLLKHPTPAPYQQPIPAAKPPTNVIPTSVHSSNGLSNGLMSCGQVTTNPQRTAAAAAAVQHNRKPSVPDVTRRPLKERLIHLLALRPLKKIELHDRLNKEGLRGSSSMTTVLKQIAHMKDNCYHLNRNLWNEVNDDWPFYSETEKQLLKRHKPQNLTPPGGSDGGSSGSGQSPTSTHPGSPPLISSTNGFAGKRPGYNEGADGFQYKRQRIAHPGKAAPPSHNATDNFSYNRPQQQPPPDPIYSRSPVEQNTQRRPVTDLRDASNMNPRSRESPNNGYFNSYDNPPVEDERNKRPCDSVNGLSFGANREKVFRGASPNNNNRLTTEDTRRTSSPIQQLNPVIPNGREKDRRNNNNTKLSSNNLRAVRVSPDSQTDSLAAPVAEKSPDLAPSDCLVADGFPDYKQNYVTITNVEQKRAYKADFSADYAEYKELYPVVAKVAKRFELLEEKLKQEGEHSSKYREIKKQIMREYQEMKKNHDHQRAKNRFQYLHDKLSHIKKLVSDYDQLQAVRC